MMITYMLHFKTSKEIYKKKMPFCVLNICVWWKLAIYDNLIGHQSNFSCKAFVTFMFFDILFTNSDQYNQLIEMSSNQQNMNLNKKVSIEKKGGDKIKILSKLDQLKS